MRRTNLSPSDDEDNNWSDVVIDAKGVATITSPDGAETVIGADGTVISEKEATHRSTGAVTDSIDSATNAGPRRQPVTVTSALDTIDGLPHNRRQRTRTLNRPGSGGDRERTRRMRSWQHHASSTRRPVSGPSGCTTTD